MRQRRRTVFLGAFPIVVLTLGLLVGLLVPSGAVAVDVDAADVEGPPGDYGDAPDGVLAGYRLIDEKLVGTFPSLYKAAGSAQDPWAVEYVLHRFPEERAYLGSGVTSERNALVVDRDADDGWRPGSLLTCRRVRLEVFLTVPETATQGPLYLNVLFDWNHDGRWAGASACAVPGRAGREIVVPEWAIRNLALHEEPYNVGPGFAGTIELPAILTGPTPGELWVRFTLSTEPVPEEIFPPVERGGLGWQGQGDFLYGETEDYLTCVIERADALFGDCPLPLVGSSLIEPPPEAGNRPPAAEDDHAALTCEAEVVLDPLANDHDPDGDPLTIVSFTQPAHGTVVLNPNGTITYVRTDGFIGTDTFSYVVCDEAGLCDGATVTIELGACADLAIEKDDAPDPVIAGETLVYTLTVQNAGPSDALDVEVEDELPDGVTLIGASPSQGSCSASGSSLSCALGTLPAGATATVTLTVQVAPDASGPLTNTAGVASSTPDPDDSNNAATETTAVIAQADLEIEKGANPSPVLAGETLVYTLTVRNLGPSVAVDVEVEDELPAAVTLLSATASQGSCSASGSAVTCALGTLPAGATATITVSVLTDPSLPHGHALTNTATVTSDTPDPDSSNNAATETTAVVTQADLAITKQSNPNPAVAGMPLIFILSVTNYGPSDAQNVVVEDPLPAQTTFVSATTSQGSCSESGGVVTCSLGTLPAGASASIAITVNVDSGYPGNEIVNTAVVTGDTPDPNPDNSDTILITVLKRSDLAIGKFDTPDPVAAGQALTWTITVDNNGPSDADDVTVTDTLPAGVTLVAVTPSQGSCSGTATIVCTLGTIPAGGQAVITVQAIVDPGYASSTLVNTATVTSGTTDPIPSNNTGQAVTTVSRVADLALTKSDDPDPVLAGSLLTYTIVVQNAGPSHAPAVQVVDTLPSDGVTFVSATASQGSCSEAGGTVTCALGALTAGSAATVTITVQVDASFTGSVLSNTASVFTTATDPDIANNSDTETTQVQSATSWDRSSLEFIGEGRRCDGFDTIIWATVQNGGDGDMAGPTTWELWYAPSGNPKNGVLIASGVIPPLASGDSYTIEYAVTQPGHYIFKAYQRPGHPGTGVLWSEEIEISGLCGQDDDHGHDDHDHDDHDDDHDDHDDDDDDHDDDHDGDEP